MGSHNIPDESMSKDVRPAGKVIRRVMPCFTEKKFRKANRALDRFMKGRWLSRETKVEERLVKRPDGSDLRVLVCRSKIATLVREPADADAGDGPAAVRRGATGLLWIHGGGYAIGIPEQDFSFADLFCSDGSCVAVMPDYRRSLDAPYPAALDDCVLALQWMHDNAADLGIDGRQLFVGGDSAGGGLTVATCLRARDEGTARVAFHMPLYPMIDDREITVSSQDNDAPVWNTASNREGWRLYLGGLAGSPDVPAYAAPARASDVSGMPPCCTYVGTIEPFHDETVAYCKALEQAGVPVFFREFEGCFHAFDILAGGSASAKEAKAFLRQTFKHAQRTYWC